MTSPIAFAGEIIGYKANILFFTDNPLTNKNSYKYFPKGVLYIQNGKILDVGDYNTLETKYKNTKLIDYSNKFILPGFIDTHIHYPQSEMIASYGSQLLDWLNKYTLPTEKLFSDPKEATYEANFFLDQLLKNGTTTALIFGTVNPVSVNSIFQAAQERNMRIIAGKVLMDRNAPSYLLDTPESAYTQSKNLILKWNNVGRLTYAVTPRFAPTSSGEELSVAGKLLKEFPTVMFQTHLAENKQEVAWVKKLFPKSRSYLDVYNHYGLVTKHSIFAHGIYIDRQDEQLLHKMGATLSFCPTSNLFLGSGLFNFKMANQYNVKVGLGTDVGAGTSFSILQTINEAYKVTQLRKAFSKNPSQEPSLNPFEALYLATLGGARALSLENDIGSFQTGKEADFIVLDPDSTELLKKRFSNSNHLEDKLFAFEMLGDDRTILQTYILGNPIK